MSTENLKIRIMRSDDSEEVVRLFSRVFSQREPCSTALGLDETTFNPLAEAAVERCKPNFLSFVCEDASMQSGQRIVGFRLSEPLFIGHHEPTDPMSAALMELQSDFLKIHPELAIEEHKAARVVHLSAVGVKEGYTGKGIAKALIKASLKQAISLGFTLAYVKASSSASQHIFRDVFGFDIIAKRRYRDFVYRGNNPLENVKEPEYFMLLEKNLENWSM